MDTYCTRCGEPWDVDYLRHKMEDDEPGFIFGGNRLVVLRCACRHERPKIRQSRRLRAVAEELGRLFGDDLDGFAAEMDDLATAFGVMEETEYANKNK